MHWLVLQQCRKRRCQPLFVLFLHHQNHMRPANVVCRHRVPRAGAGTARAGDDLRVLAPQLLCRGAAPLVAATDKQHVDFFMWCAKGGRLVSGFWQLPICLRLSYHCWGMPVRPCACCVGTCNVCGVQRAPLRAAPKTDRRGNVQRIPQKRCDLRVC